MKSVWSRCLLPALPWPTPNGPITSRRSSASPATRSSASPVSRDTLKRVTTTGLWEGTSEVAYFITDIALPATACAHAIRGHWGIENRLHYVRDVSFREDDSRIRCNPGIFARLRSFAANILRYNNVHNMSNGRYRIAVGGVDAMLSLRVM